MANNSANPWKNAQKHLSRDPLMRQVIKLVGPCTVKPRRDHFVLLCRAIFSQQISTKVARVLFDRFKKNFPRRRPTPARVLHLLTKGDEVAIAGCGLSRQKKKYLMDLSQHFIDGRIPKNLSRMADEEIIESLTAVQGIGRWTAEMFLMFILNRPDVLPVDDLGLRSAAKRFFRLKQNPTAAELKDLGERWRPYRTIASWYLWRAMDAPEDKW